MLLTKTAEGAIRLVLCLAVRKNSDFLPLKTIAEETGISFFQLGKVAQQLIKGKILNSYPGPNGGVALAKTPEKISLYEVVVAIEGEDVFTNCVLGTGDCDGQNTCQIHEYWKIIKEQILELFQIRTLNEIIDLDADDPLAGLVKL